jgi:response regulator RpfG family c-di-GMP phosphodiesterase
MRMAALLMDVGLLWVPDEVFLNDPDKLNSVGKMRLE